MARGADGGTAPRASPLRVLIAEDNEDAANSLALLLQLWGYEVQVAYNGVAALDTARTFRPQVVMLDLGLPRIDGYVLAQQLRQQGELGSATLVALTGFADDDSRLRAQKAGCDHFLVKPVDPLDVEVLLSRVRGQQEFSGDGAARSADPAAPP